jgi:hypothetical protein
MNSQRFVVSQGGNFNRYEFLALQSVSKQLGTLNDAFDAYVFRAIREHDFGASRNRVQPVDLVRSVDRNVGMARYPFLKHDLSSRAEGEAGAAVYLSKKKDVPAGSEASAINALQVAAHHDLRCVKSRKIEG